MLAATRMVPVALLFALVPALAAAQRGTAGGMGRGGRIPGIVREPGIVIPKFVNAVNLIVMHSGELALSDTQFKKVLLIKRALDSTNAPLMRRLDSLERLFRGGPIFSQPSRERLDSIADGRLLARQTIADVTDNESTFRDRAYELLNSQQLHRMQEFEAKAAQAIADEERKKKP